MLADPINKNTSKNRQVDVFSLVLVSDDNKNVSARLTTDIHKKTGSNQKQPTPLKKSYRVGFR